MSLLLTEQIIKTLIMQASTLFKYQTLPLIVEYANQGAMKFLLKFLSTRYCNKLVEKRIVNIDSLLIFIVNDDFKIYKITFTKNIITFLYSFRNS